MYEISIIGNIGSGKSTILKFLEKNGYDVEYEDVESWNFLSKFYEDKKRWGFTLQMEIINSFKKRKDNMLKYKFTERSVWEACYIFGKNMYNSGYINDHEYYLIEDISNRDVSPPDYYIYLNIGYKTCIERIKQRNRNCEINKNMSEYVEELERIYEEEIEKLKKTNKVYIINELENSEEKILKIISEIKLNGINS